LLPKPNKTRLSPEEYRAQRKKILERSGYRCEKCGRILPLQWDHKKKRSQGGGDELDNAQALCANCHDQKDNVAKSKSSYWKLIPSELRMLTRDQKPDTIVSNPNTNAGVDQEPVVVPVSANEGAEEKFPAPVNNPVPNPPERKELFTLDDIPEWLEATDAQGDPLSYCKTDLERWVMIIFNAHKFHAGTSKGAKRRSFNEVWDAALGEPIAIAYGFNEALKYRKYSLAYVKSVIKSFMAKPVKKVSDKPLTHGALGPGFGGPRPWGGYKKVQPVIQNTPETGSKPVSHHPTGEPIEIKIKKAPAPRKKAMKPAEVTPDVEWK